MLADLPRSDHARENIHEQRNIDEASLETHVSNICHSDLILMRDLKVFKQVGSETYPPAAILWFDPHA